MLLPMLAKHYRKESRTTKHIPGDERTIQRFGSERAFNKRRYLP